MFIYVGKNFTHTVSGGVVKEVLCAQCGSRYWYELSRFAEGIATAPYFIAQRWAMYRAQKSAEKKLAKMLASDCEIVPCPRCSTVQPQMMQFLRKRMYRALKIWSWVLPILGLVIVALAAWANWESRRGSTRDDPTPYYLAAAGFVGLWVLMAAIRKWLIARGGWLKAAISGAPPALLRLNEADPNSLLSPVPRAPVSADNDPWVIFSLLRIPLPDICCVCAAPGETHYKAPFVARDDDLAMALCRNCARRISRRWWKVFAIWILVWAGITAAAALIPPAISHKNAGMGILFAILTGFFGGIIGSAMFPAWWTRPFHHRWVDAKRGILRIRFDSPRFTQVFRTYVDTAEHGSPGAVRITTMIA